MKNKKLLYLLLPLTGLIWGTLIYRIWSGLGTSPETTSVKPSLSSTLESVKVPIDYALHTGLRDPFLGGKSMVSTSANKSPLPANNPIKKSVPVVNAPAAWPAVSYGGLIKNTKSNKQVALVNINGQSVFMNPGDCNNGLKLLRSFKDSIELCMGKEKRMFHK